MCAGGRGNGGAAEGEGVQRFLTGGGRRVYLVNHGCTPQLPAG